ncbi:hypothetical protein [Streptomyces ambofaciens]|uniref:hypothetical protein n=1 Tax=Streptomyces ambofaciens TaxID=1889 RepID=UPI0011DF561A
MPPRGARVVIDRRNAPVARAYRGAGTVAAIARPSERARAAGVPVVTVRHRVRAAVDAEFTPA